MFLKSLDFHTKYFSALPRICFKIIQWVGWEEKEKAEKNAREKYLKRKWVKLKSNKLNGACRSKSKDVPT